MTEPAYSINRTTHRTKRRNGKPVPIWVVRWRERGRQPQRTFEREADAQLWVAQRRAGVETTVTAKSDTGPTFGKCIDTYVAGRRVSRGRTAAERSYRKHLEGLEQLGVAELRSSDFRATVAGLVDAAKSPETIAAVIRFARGVLDQAIEDGHVQVNAAARVRGPRIVRKPIETDDVLSAAEAAKLIDTMPERWRALVAVLAYLGPRLSEALGVTVRDVDMLRKRIRFGREVAEEVDGVIEFREGDKLRGSGRWVSMPAQVLGPLQHHIEAFPPGRHGHLFVTAHGTVPHRSNFRRVFAKAITDAGLDDRGITMRQMRHSSATLMLDAGLEPRAVARRLGHSRVRTTLDVYTRWVESDEHDVTKAYEDGLRKAAERSSDDAQTTHTRRG
jgi:integrase